MITIGVILGMVLGCAFFHHTEKNESKTFLFEKVPDLVAWGGGALLIYKGFEYDDLAITLLGSALASIYICRFAAGTKKK